VWLPTAGFVSAGGSGVVWTSEPVNVPITSFPVEYKFVANGHRVSPTTRPLIWDARARMLDHPPKDGYVNLRPKADCILYQACWRQAPVMR
jgi:hypothetical protein